ncbi:hypothetical protein [Cryptosporangium phraense]|uniref:hypothetical protein n=1 Tax=Cryptosporangium phraense TaxID=2593070 RepID=UPI001478468E|nr:hypothetical protein [Cryptosporangium phraense]
MDLHARPLGTIVLSSVLVVLGAATMAQPLLRTITGPTWGCSRWYRTSASS